MKNWKENNCTTFGAIHLGSTSLLSSNHWRRPSNSLRHLWKEQSSPQSGILQNFHQPRELAFPSRNTGRDCGKRVRSRRQQGKSPTHSRSSRYHVKAMISRMAATLPTRTGRQYEASSKPDGQMTTIEASSIQVKPKKKQEVNSGDLCHRGETMKLSEGRKILR
jgi:hypothetical protein